MQGQAPQTFKDLQNQVLRWMADESDQGHLRALVKDALNSAHTRRLTSARWPFLKFPTPKRLNVVAGRQTYALHPGFGSMLYVRRLTQDDYYGQPCDLIEREDFLLEGVWPVKTQPSGNMPLNVVATEDAGKKLTIFGETADGEVAEETISAGATGSVLFIEITEIRKEGEAWSGPCQLREGSTTILTLQPTEYGKQYRTFRFLRKPETSQTLEYQFYRRPRRLVDDQDLPLIPSPFETILVYDALLDMVGYTNATPDEQRRWRDLQDQLDFDLWAEFQDGQSRNAAPATQTYIPRLD